MTICIAAICENGRAIVTASDREFGIGFTSAELEDPKIHPLFMGANPGNWHVAISGAVSNATEIMGALRLMEGELESREWYDIQTVLQKAYRKVRLSKAEGEIQAARGWSLDKFQNEGAKLLPPSTYASIDTRLSLYDLNASLIVTGFGEDGFPAVLTASNPGVVTDHTKLGFWCIGSGSPLAQANMFNRNYSWMFSVERSAYFLYESKKNSERASGVGSKETDIVVITQKQVGRLIPGTIEELQKIFDELKPREFTVDHTTHLSIMPDFKQIRASL